MNIAALNREFGIPDTITFSSMKEDIAVATITNQYAKCVVSLYGAHVLSYQPSGMEEVLWMSPLSAFESGKAIRGGIPVCFPWFGPHATDNQKAVHGFARLMSWEVKSTENQADGASVIVLRLNDSAATKEIWPYAFKAELTVTVGSELTVTLHFVNTGNETFTTTDALHTYFKVSDLENVTISGLHKNVYTNAGSNDEIIQDDELVKIKKEENRRYLSHTGDCVITDTKYGRKINVAKKGSNVTVVWNPFSETAKNIGDMPDDGYKTFVCVEAVNAYADAVTLAPNEEWSISAIISL